MEKTVRRLPDFQGVANTMSDFFGPDDCGPNEVLVRRGMMKYCGSGSVDCVMGYCQGESFNLYCIYFRDKEWHSSLGSSGCDEEVIKAISDVIGCKCP